MRKTVAARQLVCPKCGAGMRLRQATKGKTIGKYFWGCSTFPKCRETVAARIQDLPWHNADSATSIYIVCPQCAGSGFDPRTSIVRELMTRQTLQDLDIDTISGRLGRTEMAKRCGLCLGRGKRLVPEIEAARRALALEMKTFATLQSEFWDHIEKLNTSRQQLRTVERARKLWEESFQAERDLILLESDEQRQTYLQNVQMSGSNAVDGQLLREAEEVRLSGLDTPQGRKALQDLIGSRANNLDLANQHYALVMRIDSLDNDKYLQLAAITESALRCSFIQILLGQAMRNDDLENQDEREAVSGGTPEINAQEDESESDLELARHDDEIKERYPMDDWDVAPSIDLLSPYDEDSAISVEELFDHPSDEPNYGEEGDRDN